MKHKRCEACQCRPCCCAEMARRGHVCYFAGRECWCGRTGDDGLSTPRGQWPLESVALSCHPSQVEAITARNKKHGITGVEYKADGTCVISTPRAQTQLCKLEGVHNRAGGYAETYSGQSPILREDTVDFAPIEMRERSVYRNGRKVETR